MTKIATYRKILAGLLTVLLMAGSTGFSIERHSCEHCGEDISLSILTSSVSVEESCCEKDQSSEPSAMSCDLDTASCCSVEISTHELEEPYLVSVNKADIPSSPESPASFTTEADNAQPTQSLYKDLSPGPGGRQTLILISCFRT